MAVHLSRLEKLYAALAVGGGLAALVFDHFSMPRATKVSLAVVLLGILVFGLDMIVTRKAEIATRYSSSTNPSFHVFRGMSAIAWGITIIVFTALVLGFTVSEMTGWTGAKAFFGERPGILVTLVGLMITAWGVANTGKATYRYRTEERPDSRWGDRFTGVLVIPLGLCVLGLGVLQTVAPAVTDALRDAARGWGLSLIYRLKDYLEGTRIYFR